MRVVENVGAVLFLNDARVFNTAFPLAIFLRIVGGEKYGSGPAREVDAVTAFRESQAGCVHADLHAAGVVFRAIENDHFAVAHNRCGIEGVQRLPVNRGLAQRVIEDRRLVRGNDGIAACRTNEGAEDPVCGSGDGERNSATNARVTRAIREKLVVSRGLL